MWTKGTSGLSGSALNVGTHVFVSYAGEDRSVAERVVRALTSLGWRVWWDREIALGKSFDERIGERLRSAGAVLVLWSRHSVVSEWVREEASEAKRRDVLIPALIDRVEPPFGFTLRQAVDLTSWNGTSSAPEFSALVAALRALIPPVDESTPTPTTRADEFARRQKIFSHVTPAFLILTLLVTTGAVSSLWYWDAYSRVQVEHFANVRTRYGLPEGVGPLDARHVAHRSASLAFTRHGRRNPVDEVRLVNSSGDTPAPSTYVPITSLSALLPLASFDIEHPLASDVVTVTRVTFTRDAAGGILEQNAFTAAGRLVYTLRYANRETAEYKLHGFTRAMRASGIAYVRFEYVKGGPNAGLDEKHAFLDAAQQPQPTESGAYGSRRTFDERGLVRESFALGPRLEDQTNNSGLFRVVQSHSQLGDIIELALFDQRGARVTDADGVAIWRSEYDKAGNPTRLTYYDRDGQLVAVPQLGAARIDVAYDNQGRLTTATLFAADQRPVLGGQGFAKKTLEWLTPTRVSIRFYDPNFDPIPVMGLAFEVLDTVDKRGLPIEESFRDSKGEPTRVENGCSTIQLGYDAVGNNIEFRCLNEQRSLTFSTDGVSIVRSKYDDRGNPVITELFDPEGKPGNQKDFYTSIRREYNAFGKLSKETDLDARGVPRKARVGYASIAYTYDRNGNRTEEAYFDEAGRPVANVAGYAVNRSEFDGKGFEIRTSFLSPGGQLVRSNEGYATIRREYDDRGFVRASTFLDENDHRVNSIDGYALVRRERTADGKLLEISYFNDRAVPVISKRPGSGRRRWTYDALGRVIDRSDYDTTGKRMINAYGYSTIRFSYDKYGRESGRQMLDAFGRPVTFKVTVDKVYEGSVAADAGLRVGDVILTYDGEPVDTTYELWNRFELFKGDRRRQIQVERGGRIVGLNLLPGLIRGCELEERAYR
jgi:YD repeat-containing protein